MRHLLLVLLAVGTGACDPCNAVGGCEGRAQLTITGRLLRDETGNPVEGATVEFLRTGGMTLDRDSIRAVTNADGIFVLRTEALTSGLVDGDIVLRSHPTDPTAFSYRVVGQTYRVFADVGEANVMPAWSTRPSLPDLGVIVGSTLPAQQLAGARVVFSRTGGVELIGTEVFVTEVNEAGVFSLFDRIIWPQDAGDVIGDLQIDAGPGYLLRGFRVTATPEFRRPADFRIVDVRMAAARP